MAAHFLDNLDAIVAACASQGPSYAVHHPVPNSFSSLTGSPRGNLIPYRRFPRSDRHRSSSRSTRTDDRIASRGTPAVMRVTTLKAGKDGLAGLIDYYAGLVADQLCRDG